MWFQDNAKFINIPRKLLQLSRSILQINQEGLKIILYLLEFLIPEYIMSKLKIKCYFESIWIKQLPRKYMYLIQTPYENVGILDIWNFAIVGTLQLAHLSPIHLRYFQLMLVQSQTKNLFLRMIVPDLHEFWFPRAQS